MLTEEFFSPILDAFKAVEGRLNSIEERLKSPSRHPGFLTTPKAAEFLSVSPQTLEFWRHNAEGPCYVKLGRAVRYSVADLIDFMERNQIGTKED